MLENNDDIYLKPMKASDAQTLLTLRQTNHDFLQPFEPIRQDVFFTLDGQLSDIENGIKGAQDDQSYICGVFLKGTDELIGRIALTGFARGPFQNANLGYFLAQSHNGKGYMTTAVRMCTHKAFTELGLHRIQAGVMPRNTSSLRVLEKAGFRQEGLAKRYLKINGEWEDHILLAITLEDWNEHHD